jgi:hypothetical protein
MEVIMNHRWLLSGALALAAVGLSAPTANADPKGILDITLTCAGEDYDVTVAGNGVWTPAHDLDSTLVGVPIAFGEFNGVFTPTGGAPEPFTDPPFARPRPQTRNLIIECSYTVSGAFPDGTFTGAGDVTLMVPRVH